MKQRLAILMVALLGTSVFGAEPTADAETAIRAAIDSYVKAFNAGDAQALAAHWSEEGELLAPSGETYRGNEQLASSFAQYFQEAKDAKLELSDTQIKFISPRVAVETGIARVLRPEEEPSETEYEAIHVKTESGWKIDRVREQLLPPPPTSHYEQLKGLEWMIGQWSDTDENSIIETNVRWTTNQHFIVRTFRVFIEDEVDFEGSQVIGWDPVTQTIRSWMFDSDGGFGVGRWSSGEGRWTVQSLNVLADGRRASATNIYDLVDENTVQYRSIGRQVDGELLPNIGPFTVTRTVD